MDDVGLGIGVGIMPVELEVAPAIGASTTEASTTTAPVASSGLSPNLMK